VPVAYSTLRAKDTDIVDDSDLYMPEDEAPNPGAARNLQPAASGAGSRGDS
jgi:hypothetical protein